ncbi:MAG: hypothetical protein B6I35_14105 [Anaerolineaceae bacterium 4572_32.2]|nr:MAG: hypothetical protein B6I35_14105 [Anaerolineaceae bacterium 4572_32.2]
MISTVSIIAKADELGASLAGIASIASLKASPSYDVCGKPPYYEGYGSIEWPKDAKSVLVLALSHEASKPELDWWSHMPGATLGNRQLMNLASNMAQWINQELDINAHLVVYHIEAGGIFLKDSAALAGLGVIGKNNLLITPELGPRVRLRALFLDADLEPTGPTAFNPCEGCDMPCRRACPQEAFRDGSYNLPFCNEQMAKNEVNSVVVENWVNDSPGRVIKYCRACELACPVAR